MIVLDASAAYAALDGHPVARAALGSDEVHSPELVDLEVLSILRRRESAGLLDRRTTAALLQAWSSLGLTRHSPSGHLARNWELRHTVTPYDAAYVALAEHLDCALLTADARLSRAPGVRCLVTVLPPRACA